MLTSCDRTLASGERCWRAVDSSFGRGVGSIHNWRVAASPSFMPEEVVMKVLVADKFPAEGLAKLRAAGCDVISSPDLDGPTLTAAVRETGAEVVVVRSTEVRADALEAGRLGLVVRAGAGYNTIDTKKASELGIYVSNCPGKNSVAVAELAMALILALDRHVPDGVADLRGGTGTRGSTARPGGSSGAPWRSWVSATSAVRWRSGLTRLACRCGPGAAPSPTRPPPRWELPEALLPPRP